jgi:ElaB/YqjD/DUF883 family membrane-anchored ribosome-binding protein
MSPNDSDVRSTTAKRNHGGADVQDVTAELDAIRADIQNLTSTLGRFANKQFGYAQGRAFETAREAEESIRQNPLSAVAIAAGVGFVFGVFSRR